MDDRRSTEQASPRFKDLDRWPSREILEALVGAQFSAVAAVWAVLASIERAAEASVARLRQGGRLAYGGAGTSGRLAVLDGVELIPTFGFPEERLFLFLAGGAEAMWRPVEGAEDDQEAAARLAQSLRHQDVLIAVAASGKTPFTLELVRQARIQGALTVALANNPGTPLLEAAEHPLLLDTGPEVIAGSTRLAAGTAQKVALNLLSTLIMVRLGLTYGNLMVHVRPTNQKLHQRAVEIIAEVSGTGRLQAQQALREAGGEVPLGILLALGVDAERARALLNERSLRQALEEIWSKTPLRPEDT
jgi:N-acetylmuramic acid 6-phosphate etherase